MVALMVTTLSSCGQLSQPLRIEGLYSGTLTYPDTTASVLDVTFQASTEQGKYDAFLVLDGASGYLEC